MSHFAMELAKRAGLVNNFAIECYGRMLCFDWLLRPVEFTQCHLEGIARGLSLPFSEV